jgi:hypothetical protein
MEPSEERARKAHGTGHFEASGEKRIGKAWKYPTPISSTQKKPTPHSRKKKWKTKRLSVHNEGSEGPIQKKQFRKPKNDADAAYIYIVRRNQLTLGVFGRKKDGTDHTFVDIQLSHWLPLSGNYLIGWNNKVVKVHMKYILWLEQ